MTTPVPDPFQYVPVEGIYTTSTNWQFVLLCGDCLRVISITKRPTKEDDGRNTWEWDSHPPGDLCPFCGFMLKTASTPEVVRFAVHCATARRRYTGVWWWPPSWGDGHWEVRDFNAFALKKESS